MKSENNQVKKIQPKLTFNEAMIEISNRTGLPANAIYRVLWTYIEIVKECLDNKVSIAFGDLGVFRYQYNKPRYDVNFYNPHTREHSLIKCIPAYDVPIFRCARQWQAQVKKNSIEYYKNHKEEEE